MNSTCIDMLINVSVNYPELNGIKYQTDEETIALKFALKGMKTGDHLMGLQMKLRKCYHLYHTLYHTQPEMFNISVNELEGIVFFTLYRDQATLTEEEIDLYINILKEDYDHYLVKDNINIKTIDTYKQSLKKNLLHRICKSRNCNSFWAFRQGGKVFVLNK